MSDFTAVRLAGLNDHLGDTSASKSLAPNESLLLDRGEQVAYSCESENHGGGDQASSGNSNTEPLDQSHNAIGSGASVVCRNLANRGIESRRGRADSQQQWDLDEEDDEGRYAIMAHQFPLV